MTGEMGTGRTAVHVLGPIRVVDDGGVDRTPSGALQRRLLALLVLRRGRAVAVDEAVAAMWPDALPDDPTAALQHHVSRLRRALPDGLVQSVGDGYRLDTTRVRVDADELAAWLALAPAAPLDDVERVLAGWSGPALPELSELDDGRIEQLRLDELRRRAHQAIAERALARGDVDDAIATLTRLVDEDPLREATVAVLIDALAAAGRRTEALRAYDELRHRLARELGIDPSAELTARHAALLDGAAPVATSPTAAPLPAPATSLVGRDDLVTAVADLVDTVRVVTLVGPGGVGKTRVLLAVGARLLRASSGDRTVVLAELAPVGPDGVDDAVAAALGVHPRPGTATVDRIVEVLRDHDAVVLLDNCEHVLDAAAALVDHVVRRCPGARFVATSRERLRVDGEHVRTIPTLPTGVGDEAVRLFVDRAAAVTPGFVPGPEDLAVVHGLVQRLDGLPLAIELAAARLHTHALEEVVAGLEDRFALLSAGPRTTRRHESLAAAVAWSFDALDDRLRDVLTRVSVFAGAFDAADAAAVCGRTRADVAGALAELVERSLVMRAGHHDFVLLETLRAFGREQLDRTGAATVVAQRHAEHHVDWAEQADARLLLPGSAAVESIDARLAELRAALDWLLGHGDAASAGRLIASLLDYGILRLRPDVLGWGAQVTAADPDHRTPTAAIALVADSYATWMSGDVATSGVRARQARAVAERDGGPVPAEVAMALGAHALFEGRLDESAEWYERSAVLAGQRRDRAQDLHSRGSAVLARGYAGDATVGSRAEALLADVGEEATAYAAYAWYCCGEAVVTTAPSLARQRLDRAVELAERAGSSFVVGTAGATRASLDARAGDPERAAADYRWLIDHWRRAGMWSTQWTMLRSIAALLARLGRAHEAAVLVGAVRSTASGHRIFGADAIALEELAGRLSDELGASRFAAAVAEGERLDDDAAVEHARRSL